MATYFLQLNLEKTVYILNIIPQHISDQALGSLNIKPVAMIQHSISNLIAMSLFISLATKQRFDLHKVFGETETHMHAFIFATSSPVQCHFHLP